MMREKTYPWIALGLLAVLASVYLFFIAPQPGLSNTTRVLAGEGRIGLLVPVEYLTTWDLEGQITSRSFSLLPNDTIVARISNDGKWIAIEHTGGITIQSSTPSLSRQIQIPKGTHATWASNSLKLVYAIATGNGPPLNTIMMTDLSCLEFGGPCPDARTLIEQADDPALSPDERTLAYVDDQGGHLASMDALESPMLLVAKAGCDPTGWGPNSTAWSPTGEHLAFLCADGLRIYNLRSDERKVLPIVAYRHQWLNENEVVFVGGSEVDEALGTPLEYDSAEYYYRSNAVFVINIHTGAMRRLTAENDLRVHWFSVWPPSD